MNVTETRLVNPLKEDALTHESVKVGDDIKYWTPRQPNSVHRAVVESAPYFSADDDLVIDIRHRDGHISTELTSEIGLSGWRHTGKWTGIAIPDDEE